MRYRRISSFILAFSLAVAGISGTQMPHGDSNAVYAESVLGAPSNIEVIKENETISLTWDLVDGADAYRVYQYDSKEKGYSLFKTVKGGKVIVLDLSDGNSKECYFKVATLTRAGQGYEVNGLSKVVAVKPVELSEREEQKPQVVLNTSQKTKKKSETKEKAKVEKKDPPKIEDMSKEIPIYNMGISELERIAFTIFDDFRSKLVVKGYKVRVLQYKADVGKYKAVYEVSWQGTPMYTLTESYEAIIEDESTEEYDENKRRQTGIISMVLKEIDSTTS